jgi:hypothetical protein
MLLPCLYPQISQMAQMSVQEALEDQTIRAGFLIAICADLRHLRTYHQSATVTPGTGAHNVPPERFIS